MSWTILFLCVAGFVFGSFLNVLVFRYDPEDSHGRGILKFFKKAGGRSRCLHCGKQLRWYELIPVLSFVALQGKCRSCKKNISLQYPVVELASAAIFVFVPEIIQEFLFRAGNWVPGAVWMWYALSALWITVFLSLLAAFFIDARHYVIPNYLNLFIFILGIIWASCGLIRVSGDVFGRGSFLGAYADLFMPALHGEFFHSFIFQHLAGAVIGCGIFLVIIFLSKGRGMGLGDAKLMAGLGLLFGYPDVLFVMMLAFILGTLYAVPLLAKGVKGMKDMLPFGPFIVLAACVAFFFGARLLGAYFGIIERIGMSL